MASKLSMEARTTNAHRPRGRRKIGLPHDDTGESGEIAVTVPIASGDRSFMIVGTSSEAELAVLSIDDPSGAIRRRPSIHGEARSPLEAQ